MERSSWRSRSAARMASSCAWVMRPCSCQRRRSASVNVIGGGVAAPPFDQPSFDWMRVPLLFSMTVAEQAGIPHFNLVTLNWAPLATNDMLLRPSFHVKVGFTAGPSWLLYSEPLLPANTLVWFMVAMGLGYTGSGLGTLSRRPDRASAPYLRGDDLFSRPSGLAGASGATMVQRPLECR